MGTKAYVTVVHGCLCLPRAAGAVEVVAMPPVGVQVLDAEVTDGSQVFTMALAPGQEMAPCVLDGAMDRYGGGAPLHTEAGLLTGDPLPASLQLRLHFQAAGDDGWATVPIADVCSAES